MLAVSNVRLDYSSQAAICCSGRGGSRAMAEENAPKMTVFLVG